MSRGEQVKQRGVWEVRRWPGEVEERECWKLMGAERTKVWLVDWW